jgi:hypothetical protein
MDDDEFVVPPEIASLLGYDLTISQEEPRTADGIVNPKTCACQQLHFRCEPTRCDKAWKPGFSENIPEIPSWPIEIRLKDMLIGAREDCQTCTILSGGIFHPEICPSWDPSCRNQNWPESGLVVSF